MLRPAQAVLHKEIVPKNALTGAEQDLLKYLLCTRGRDELSIEMTVGGSTLYKYARRDATGLPVYIDRIREWLKGNATKEDRKQSIGFRERYGGKRKPGRPSKQERQQALNHDK